MPTSTPGSINGRTSGKKIIVISINMTISPTDAATSAFAICASFGNAGAPAAQATRIRPIFSGSSNGRNVTSRNATAGIIIKLATIESTTKRTFFNGCIICFMVRLSPIESIVERIKTRVMRSVSVCNTDIFTPFLFSILTYYFQAIVSEQIKYYGAS